MIVGFRTLPVDREQAVTPEDVGSKRKYWLRRGQRQYIFKAEERGTGEDWAEVVSAELCKLLGIPHVQYTLASEYVGGAFVCPGVISENLIGQHESLILGNILLMMEDPQYPGQQRFKVKQHCCFTVFDAIRNFRLPQATEAMPAACQSAGDAFIGYLMLDAWIANTDRHHENWAVVLNAAGVVRLTPTFDHGAALAHSLTDNERQERLQTRDQRRSLKAFVERGQSALYLSDDEPKPMKLVEAFEAFSQYAPEVGNAWLERLSKISLEQVRDILERVPDARMSPVARDFTMALLDLNQQRLLDTKRKS